MGRLARLGFGWAPLAFAAGLLVLSATTVAAATIVIVNNDGPSEGFNDPTAVAPVGGNTGTTRGQQRLIVFQAAASVWGSLLSSSVTIRVVANFDPLTPCDATSGVLGSAGPVSAVKDFPGAELADTWYHIALGNKMAGSDLAPSADDISAHFNSNVDNNTCLGTSNWYYGLDGNEGIHVDLLPVVLHELGHGLGFSTLVNLSTGVLFNGSPDAYARLILDTGAGLHWSQMTNAQRAASAINTGHVVWDGRAVTARAPSILGPRPIVRVNSPPAIAANLEFGTAQFGPPLSSPGVTGAVVLVNDGGAPTSDACSPIVNGGQVSGKIALIDRGTCTFVSKAQAAEAAGATAVVIVNNVSGPPPLMGGEDPGIGIPVVSVTQADGNSIRSYLATGVNMTIGVDLAHLGGADDTGKLLLYAPNPLESGSSISHWDPSATPDLLMEPFISADLTTSVDLTRYHFEDIGWFPHLTAVDGARAGVIGQLSNAPNPFLRATTIGFQMGRPGTAELEVFDLSGRLVKRLFFGRLPAGAHAATWDGTDRDGRRVESGVYLSRLKADGVSLARRMVLLD